METHCVSQSPGVQHRHRVEVGGYPDDPGTIDDRTVKLVRTSDCGYVDIRTMEPVGNMTRGSKRQQRAILN